MPAEQQSGLGCSLLVFGGFIPALLYLNEQRRRIQCARCKFIFFQPAMPRSPVSVFAMRIIALAVFFMLVWLIALTVPNGELPIPNALRELEQMIAAHPRAVVLVFLPILPVLILVCLVASWVGNFRYRRQLRKTYRTYVGHFAQVPQAGSQDDSATPSQPAFPVQVQDQGDDRAGRAER